MLTSTASFDLLHSSIFRNITKAIRTRIKREGIIRSGNPVKGLYDVQSRKEE
uniref:Uncharacterized protein n=1 Tax=Rhizophagus irregularis (strain DAOM 181602 / DAOM 197198 / MUCL 43194) TaxID=747089 RepID=U9USP5_RHIID